MGTKLTQAEGFALGVVLPGRIGELDGFSNTPAVLISDNGKINAEWCLVK